MSFRHLTSTTLFLAVGLTAAGLAISVTTSSAATLDDGLVVHFDRTGGPVQLPDDVLHGLTDITVTAQVAHVPGGRRTITCTLGRGAATHYEDGVATARKTGVTTSPDSIDDTIETCLGRSVDGSLQGEVRDFRIYSRVLSPGEARELGKETASARPAADLASLDLGDTSAVTEDLTLSAGTPGGSSFSWESSRPSVVSATGVVTRPEPRSGSSTVTLTATASYAGHTATRDFTLTVPEDISDRQKVDDAMKDLVIPDEIRGDITLPAKGPRDVTFTWQSSDPRLVSATGEVTRPPHGSKPRIAHISVRAAKGYTYNTRYFTLTVLPLPAKAAMEGSLFTYVTGEASDEVRFAVSGSDPAQRTELNRGRPVLRSEYGVRDPFVIRSEDGDSFSLVAMRQDGSRLEIWESIDLVTWSEQRHVMVSAGTPRFGTALPVSKAEMDRLLSGPPPVRANGKGVLVDYDLASGSGPVIADLSGNRRAATIRGDITRSSAGLVFGGKRGYLDLPDDLTSGLDQLTVSAQVEVGGNWRAVTCTMSNGVLAKPDELSGLITTPNSGPRFEGRMRRLTVWNRVLTDSEIAALQP